LAVARQFIDVKNENRSFSELSLSQGRAGTLIGRAGQAPFAEPQRVEALLTSSSLFHLLGAKARYGRLSVARRRRARQSARRRAQQRVLETRIQFRSQTSSARESS
jgi:hypothetical protein